MAKRCVPCSKKAKPKAKAKRGLRGVQFVAKLSSPKHIETVKLTRCGGTQVGVLMRFNREIRRFVPGPTQLSKIRRRSGSINITSKQIAAASRACGGQ